MKTTMLVMFLAAATAAAFSTGCTRTQQGAAAGGALGAVAGATYVNTSGFGHLTGAQGALIGGSSGAAVGALAGDAYEEITEEDLEREDENLRAQLEDAEAELARLRAEEANRDMAMADESRVRDLEDRLASRDRELQNMRRELEGARSSAPVTANMNMTDSELQSELDRARERAAAAERELAEMRALVNELCRRAGDDGRTLMDRSNTGNNRNMGTNTIR